MQGEPTCYRDGDKVGEGREEDCEWTLKRRENRRERERKKEERIKGKGKRGKGKRKARVAETYGDSLHADDMARRGGREEGGEGRCEGRR